MKLADIHQSMFSDIDNKTNGIPGNVSITLDTSDTDDFNNEPVDHQASNNLDDFSDDVDDFNNDIDDFNTKIDDLNDEPSDEMDDDLKLRMMKTAGNPDDSYGTGQVDSDGQGAILSQ